MERGRLKNLKLFVETLEVSRNLLMEMESVQLLWVAWAMSGTGKLAYPASKVASGGEWARL